METHQIDCKQDLDALMEYCQQYNLFLSEALVMQSIQDGGSATITFQFEEHEAFTIPRTKENIHWLRTFLSEYKTVLIFGKDSTQNIVSCEPTNTGMVLFIEKDGVVSEKHISNYWWILSSVRHNEDWQRLEGTQFYKWIKRYSNRDEWEEERKYLKKFKTYSIWDDKESAMVSQGFTYFKGMKVDDVSVLSFDIETVGLRHDNNSKVLLISNTYRNRGVITRKLFAYDEYSSDAKMLEAWCAWVREVNPSIILGHNVMSFDLPYLEHCATINATSLKLGRDGSKIRFNDWESKFRKDGSQSIGYKKCYIFGREIIDTMYLAYKYDFGRNYDSYGLKPIIKHEGLESKDRVFYDASKIRENYKIAEEWKKIKDYCIFDADDSLKLYDLMVPSQFYFTQSIPKSFQEMVGSATGSQLNSVMVRSYLQIGYSIPQATEKAEYEGAVSFGVPGIYRNTVKLDYASMYPSIMRQFRVYDKFKDMFGHFLQLVEYFTIERLKNKKLAKETGDRYYKDLEQSQKIGANSLYGFLGTPGLLFNSCNNAAFVTRKGRELIGFTIDWATGKLKEGQNNAWSCEG